MNQQTFTIAEREGCALRVEAYWRPGAPPGPALLWLHGGALITGSRRMLPAEQAALYVEAGFTVAATDYRLAPETPLPGIVADVGESLAWLRRADHHLPVDPARVALVGHSAGGYLALLVGVAWPAAVRAIVSVYGYGDLAGDWATQPSPYYLAQQPAFTAPPLGAGGAPLSASDAPDRLNYYFYCRQQGLWPWAVTGLTPVKGTWPLEKWSPARRVTAQFPPTLLVHGETDADVPAAQSVQMAAALAAANVAHELLLLPGRGHGFDLEPAGLNAPDTACAFAAMRTFLQRHTAPRANQASVE